MNPPSIITGMLALALALPATARDETAKDTTERLVDRVVAVVDEDPILLSDIRRRIGLGLVEKQPGEDDRQLERRVLDILVDQRLRLHEVERHDFGQLPADEVERQVERIRANFADQDALRRSLDRLGLDEAGLQLLVTRQLRVLLYVEKRLGPRVFIKQEDVRAYYDDVLTGEMRRRGEEPPPLESVSEQIHELLYEERLNRQIEAWTEELRLEAEIDDFLDSGERELPPVLQRIEG